MANFYFTFGSNPAFPYGRDDFVQVVADDIREAVTIFRHHHPNRPGSNLVNCAFWYTEDEFSKFREEFYPGREPVETLTA